MIGSKGRKARSLRRLTQLARSERIALGMQLYSAARFYHAEWKAEFQRLGTL